MYFKKVFINRDLSYIYIHIFILIQKGCSHVQTRSFFVYGDVKKLVCRQMRDDEKLFYWKSVRFWFSSNEVSLILRIQCDRKDGSKNEEEYCPEDGHTNSVIMHTHTYIYTNTLSDTHTQTHTHTATHTYVHTHACAHIPTHTRIRTHTHTFVHTHSLSHTRTSEQTHTIHTSHSRIYTYTNQEHT